MHIIYCVKAGYERPGNTKACFTNRELAEKVAEDLTAEVYDEWSAWVEQLEVYETEEDYREHNPENIKQKALAKLTTREKKVLGLE